MEIKREQRNQDLSWFIDMHQAGKLELTPPYQRKSVWSPKDRKFFLDTIFNNFPCPAIYLQKEITDKSVIYNVVDGKQRLQTILDFFNNKLRIPEYIQDARLAGKRWKDIENEPEHRYRFYNYSFSVEQLQCEEDVQWDEIFNRVNRNQKTLKDQELRHARFNGWLITKAEAEAGNNFWTTMKVSTRGRAKRMADVEFISILMLVMLEEDFVGFPQDSIDELYVKYDFDRSELAACDPASNFEDDETNNLITEDRIVQFEEDFERVKQVILQITNSNDRLIQQITQKTLTHLYSIWALIAFNLSRDIEAKSIADALVTFFERCETFDNSQLDPKNMTQDPLTQLAYKYYKRTTGAATEKTPRKDRHEALIAYLGWDKHP